MLCLVVGLLVVGTVFAPAVAAQGDHPAEITHDGEELVLESAPNQTVEGTSELTAGTTIAVRLRSSDSQQPFLKSREVTIAADGSFEARFDLSDIDEPSEFVAVVMRDNEEVSDRVPGRIVEPGTPIQSSSVEMQAVTMVEHGETARLNVSMPAEGQAVLAIGNESQDGYGITVELDDRNGDGWVVLRFDTAAAGIAEPTVAVGGDDGYEVRRPESRLDAPIEPGEYMLSLYTDLSDEPVLLGQLIVKNGHAGDGTLDGDTDQQATYSPDSESWWYESAPGIAGAIALVSGLTALRLYGQ